MHMDANEPSPARRVDRLADAFEAAWRAARDQDHGQPPGIAWHLARAPESIREALAVELVAIDAHQRRQRGERPTASDYLAQVPELAQMSVDWRAPAGLGDDDSGANAPDQPTRDMTASPQPRPEPGTNQTPQSTDIPGYAIVETIASGGMGTVLRAHHAALERTVALKVPLNEAVRDAAGRERFLREARAAAKLRHANICPVYDVGEHAGRPFMAMAFIDGPTLRDWAKQHRPNPREAAQLIAKLARAVEYAHQHGLIHRDIKPANVILDAETGELMLTDFGLAKEHGTASAVDMTQSGQIIGTPAYMAPEQAAGHREDVGPLSDVYALGAVLFDLLCDRPPHTGTTGEILSKLQRDAAPSPRRFAHGLHRDLETICLKALMRDPRDRYASAAALADDLERFAAGESIRARPTPCVVRLTRHMRRHPVMTAAIVTLLVAAMIVIGLASTAYDRHRLAELREQFNEALEEIDGSADRLAAADALIEPIARLGPDEPATRRWPRRSRTSSRSAAACGSACW